jgi:hypothetical protein
MLIAEARAIRVCPHRGYAVSVVAPSRSVARLGAMTFVWFIVWFVANLIGDNEPLTFDPVNFWAGALIFAVALDLGTFHART